MIRQHTYLALEDDQNPGRNEVSVANALLKLPVVAWVYGGLKRWQGQFVPRNYQRQPAPVPVEHTPTTRRVNRRVR